MKKKLLKNKAEIVCTINKHFKKRKPTFKKSFNNVLYHCLSTSNLLCELQMAASLLFEIAHNVLLIFLSVKNRTRRAFPDIRAGAFFCNVAKKVLVKRPSIFCNINIQAGRPKTAHTCPGNLYHRSK